MKRLHVHVAVDDLDQSVGFYSTLFGAGPDVAEADYAKWLLDDPRVNFAISSRGDGAGVDHLGIQVSSDGELAEITGRLAAAEQTFFQQADASCCYARGDKTWARDPQGVSWETFHTTGAITVYGDDTPACAEAAAETACCAAAEPASAT